MFGELVEAGLAEGLRRADAEARARDIMYGDTDTSEVAFLNELDEVCILVSVHRHRRCWPLA